MKFKLAQPAYGKDAGDVVDLDESDPLVKLNEDAGVISRAEKEKPEEMTCPICAESMKRPPRFDGESDLADHYADKHAAFAVPAWTADPEGGRR